MRLLSLLMLVFVFLLPAAAPVRGQDPGRKPVLVASTTQIADFARQIVGDRLTVLCILAPGADPHTYQPTPDDVAKVLQADLCLENGLNLEGKNWMGTLARDAGKQIVTCAQGVEPIQIPGHGEAIPDPHAWFSPKNVAVYVNNVTRAVTDLDPQGKWEYESRATLFLQQLRTLDAWVRQQISQIPPQQRVLVTTHDAFNYFCREYRLNEQNDFLSIAPVGWSTGAEVGGGMTPQRRAQVIDSIRKSGARAIFVETTISPKLIREIAAETGVKIGGELYSDSMGTAGSAGETYVGMMRENIIRIVAALR
jgi:manganese/iron transport system substrate-binding protein